LDSLFDGGCFEAFPSEVGLDSLAVYVCQGGWPAALDKPSGFAHLIPQQYLKAVFEDSAPRMKMKPTNARRLFASLARNNGTAATLDTLACDMAWGEHDEALAKPAHTTVESYLDFFRSIYLLEELPGWDAPIRSRKRLRTKPKRYIVDPSLALSMLGMNEMSLLNDLQTFGIMFENMCIRDLHVYVSANSGFEGAELRYYHDDFGLEVDAIIQLPDGRWGGMEIKLSENKVAEGVKRLLTLKEKIAENEVMKNRQPSFLAVLVGRTPFARTTPEGIHIIPITSLTA
jgi:predicted AAA+ superfamily ATPase